MPRPLRVSALLTAACAALLFLAPSALAETLTGESDSPLQGEALPLPELELVHASGTYDSSGKVSVSLTTAGPPSPVFEEEPNETLATTLVLHLANPDSECEALQIFSGGAEISVPGVGMYTSYASALAKGKVVTSPESSVEVGAIKEISGNTTVLSLSSGLIQNAGLNCVFIFIYGTGGGGITAFSLKAPPPPPPPPEPGPPAKLVIATPKALKLSVGAWKTVKVKVKNVSGVSSKQGSLKVKPAKGIKLRPASQKLPSLTPGGSWTLSFQVQASEEAKPKSTLQITGSAPGSTAKSSLTVKLKS